MAGSGTIRMKPEVMRTRAGEVDRRAEEMRTLISNMDRLLVTLEGEWEGAAMEGYRSRYNEIKTKTFTNAVELFEEIAHNLRETAKILEETDRNINSQFTRKG